MRVQPHATGYHWLKPDIYPIKTIGQLSKENSIGIHRNSNHSPTGDPHNAKTNGENKANGAQATSYNAGGQSNPPSNDGRDPTRAGRQVPSCAFSQNRPPAKTPTPAAKTPRPPAAKTPRPPAAKTPRAPVAKTPARATKTARAARAPVRARTHHESQSVGQSLLDVETAPACASPPRSPPVDDAAERADSADSGTDASEDGDEPPAKRQKTQGTEADETGGEGGMQKRRNRVLCLFPMKNGGYCSRNIHSRSLKNHIVTQHLNGDPKKHTTEHTKMSVKVEDLVKRKQLGMLVLAEADSEVMEKLRDIELQMASDRFCWNV